MVWPNSRSCRFTHEAALKATGIKAQGFIAMPFTATSLLLALDAALLSEAGRT